MSRNVIVIGGVDVYKRQEGNLPWSFAERAGGDPLGSPLLYGAKQPARISPRTGATRTLWSLKAGSALPGRHEQHHRTAEFIPHDFRIGFQKARFRLRLHKFQQFESVLEKSVDVGRQGFVILHDLFAEETGLADALGKIAVHGPVEMLSLIHI